MIGEAAWAASGVVPLTGRADGPPLVPPGTAASRAAELAGLLAEAGIVIDGPPLLGERASWTGRTRQGALSVGGSCRLLATADGWAAVSCARPDDPALLRALTESDSDLWPAVTRWLADHTGAELAERAALLGIAAAPVARPADPAVPVPGRVRPVEGLLVADFSALWAGPLCAHLLGLGGARVVKVETPSRPDGARHGDPGFYRLLHAGHRSVVLDPDTASGRAAMAALVEAADIVIEASRPRALARFGLSADKAVAAGTTWVSITAHGRAADRIGFGDDVAAAAGLVAFETSGGPPLFCGDALADPLTGLTAAVLAASAEARLWDLSMAGVVAATLPEDPPLLARAARPGRGGAWVVDTPAGPVPVEPPGRRSPAGDAPESGADTEAVLRELRLR